MRADVYLVFGYSYTTGRCPSGGREVLVRAITSSAYLRRDHHDEARFCPAPGSRRPAFAALIGRIADHIDLTVRNELPAADGALDLTPPHRATWDWRQHKGRGGGGWIISSAGARSARSTPAI